MTTFVARSALVAAVLAAAAPARAESPAGSSVAGIWTLVSYTRVDPATGVETFPFGQKPSGTFFLLPDGHMATVLTAEGREPAPPGSEGVVEKQAKLFRTMTAYTGTWSVTDGTFTVRVEVAGAPEWVGTDQKREFKLEGDTLRVRTQPMRSVSDGKTYVYVLTWRRLPAARP